ncbi:MAG: alkyl hydroperoxide reductase subunit F [Planctomycetota bacterium]|jgi:alkyl hydroperoxide reductase subunit F
MFDLIIIGAGPAGTAAAVYAARKQLKTLIITKEFGGQSVVSAEIYNWIGSKAISGSDLAKDLKEHAKDYEGEHLTIIEGHLVTETTKIGDGFSVSADNGETYTTKTVLIVSGSGRRKLEVPGADTFENKGVVYCASCDGPLFADQNVAVIGGGNAGFESAAQLAAYCKSVTIIHRSAEFRADQITVEKVLEKENVTALTNAVPTEVLGEKFVSGMKYKNKETDEEVTIPVTGIFVEIGQIPNNTFLGDLVDLEPHGHIIVDPRTQRTSEAGIWAAGDITDALYHQNNIAAGDAVKALENIYLYLHAGK